MNMKRDVGSGETGSDEAPNLRYFHVSHVSHVREPESTRVEASQRTTVTRHWFSNTLAMCATQAGFEDHASHA